MLEPTIYGFADEENVEKALVAGLASVNADSKEALAAMLGEAVATLMDINASIPHHNKNRHLIAGALEQFANKHAEKA